jgi:predicted cobalt transporter CbtA
MMSHSFVAWMFASLVISAIGFGLLSYGRKMARPPQLAVGVALLVYPYFVPTLVPMLIVAAALLAGLYVSIRFGW